MEEKLELNKYKIFLIILKSIPIIWSFLIFINMILRQIGVNIYFLNILCGISLIPIVFLLLASIVFQFCSYHRMFIYYILVIWILRVLEFYYIITPYSIQFFIVFLLITFLFMVFALYKYLKKT